MINTFLNKQFNLLDRKNDRLLLICIVFAFSVFFINVFEPWNIGRWFSDSGFIQFLRLSSYGFVVALVFLFTQFPLRRLFKIQQFKIKSYLLWFILEILLICFLYIVMYGNPIGNFMNDMGFALRYTLPGICIPYSFAILVIHYKHHRNEIKKLQLEVSKPSQEGLIPLKDEKGKTRFSVLSKDLLILESTDNYISVYYILDGKIERELLRNTMKNMEMLFTESSIIRCHRSFMVNTQNIERVKTEGKKLHLKIRQLDKQVPVSEKYSSLFSGFLS